MLLYFNDNGLGYFFIENYIKLQKLSIVAWLNETNTAWKFISEGSHLFPSFDYVHCRSLGGGVKSLRWQNIQGDTKKTVITKNRITSKISFRLTQTFRYIRSGLCSRHLQSSSLYYKNSLFDWHSKNVLQMSSPSLQAHLDPAGKVLDDPPLESLLLLLWLLPSGHG